MRLPGSRTLENIAVAAQERLFDATSMYRVVARREHRQLVQAMGFDGQWDEHRRFQMDFLRRNGLTSATRLLEIGFGPLTLGIPAIRELDVGNYTGVDVRESAANLAYQQIAKESLAGRNPRLIVSDSFGSKTLRDETFDIVWSFSVLYHLSDDIVATWFSQVGKRLTPDGRYWANINVSADESRWLQFPFLKRQPAFYSALAARNGLSMVVLGTLADQGFRGEGEERDNLLLAFSRA